MLSLNLYSLHEITMLACFLTMHTVYIKQQSCHAFCQRIQFTSNDEVSILTVHSYSLNLMANLVYFLSVFTVYIKWWCWYILVMYTVYIKGQSLLAFSQCIQFASNNKVVTLSVYIYSSDQTPTKTGWN